MRTEKRKAGKRESGKLAMAVVVALLCLPAWGQVSLSNAKLVNMTTAAPAGGGGGSAPVLSSVSCGTPTRVGMTITWSSDIATINNKVVWSTHSDLSASTTTTGADGGTSHSIGLVGLYPGTTYYYQVQSDANSQTSYGSLLNCATASGIDVVNVWRGLHNSVGAFTFNLDGTTGHYANAPTAGSTLVVAVSNYNGNTSTVGDNIDGTTGWNQRVGNTYPSGVATSVSLTDLKNIPAGITQLTITPSANGYQSVVVYELGGASTSASFGAGSSTHGSSNNPQIGSVNNTTSPAIFVAAMVDQDSTGGGSNVQMDVNGTGSSGGTWSLWDTTLCQNRDNNTYQGISVPFLRVTSGTTPVSGWNTVSSQWAAVISYWK